MEPVDPPPVYQSIDRLVIEPPQPIPVEEIDRISYQREEQNEKQYQDRLRLKELAYHRLIIRINQLIIEAANSTYNALKPGNGVLRLRLINDDQDLVNRVIKEYNQHGYQVLSGHVDTGLLPRLNAGKPDLVGVIIEIRIPDSSYKYRKIITV
jgi:hypothetical protein